MKRQFATAAIAAALIVTLAGCSFTTSPGKSTGGVKDGVKASYSKAVGGPLEK